MNGAAPPVETSGRDPGQARGARQREPWRRLAGTNHATTPLHVATQTIRNTKNNKTIKTIKIIKTIKTMKKLNNKTIKT